MRFRKSHDVAVDEENPYWMSFSDIMSTLLVIFILFGFVAGIRTVIGTARDMQERQLRAQSKTKADPPAGTEG